MNKGSILLRSTSQEFYVSTTEISASGGANSPVLLLPTRIEFCPLHESRNNITTFEVLLAKAELYATEKNLFIAETSYLLSDRVMDKWTRYIPFSFPISRELTNSIEKLRKTDVSFTLKVHVQVALHEKLMVNKNGETQERLFINATTTGQGSFQFTIEQSVWVTKILPKLGHNSYKLIELPATNQLIPEEYELSLAEFEEARRFFMIGEYDKTVAHCRAALDPFKKPQFENLKTFVQSKSEYDWANTVLHSTEEWLEKIIKATSSFTSKTHHAPSVGHFSRVEAEIVLMVTTAIIAYIGKIEYKPE